MYRLVVSILSVRSLCAEMRSRPGLLFILCFFSYQALASRSFMGNWDVFTLTTPAKNHVFFYYQSETRVYFERTQSLGITQRDEQLIRLALGLKATEELSFWGGYDLFQLLQDSRQNEQNVWLQGQYSMKTSSIKLISRTRLEERNFSLRSKTALRLRQLSTLMFKSLFNKPVYPTVYDELFLNLNHPEWVSNKTISQNRIFLGVTIPLNEVTSCVAGFLSRTNYNSDSRVIDNVVHLTVNVVL